MSLSWRDPLLADISPHRLQLQRRTPDWRGGRPLAEASIDCGNGDDDTPAWAPALATLRDVLREPRWAGSAATAVLSDHFVRYLTIPWDEQLVTAEEQQAMVRHAFVQAHGAPAEGWTFRWDVPAPPAPCLASAVDGALLAGLRDAFSGAALPLVSIQPRLMAAFNASRDQLPGRRDCWLLVEEAGRICLTWIHDDAPGALYSQRIDDDWLAELPGLLERGLLLAGAGSAPGAVYLQLATAHEVAAELPAGWSLHLLRPTNATVR